MGIKVIVNGATGKMGQEAIKAINNDQGLELVGALHREKHLAKVIQAKGAQVVVDFTSAIVAYENCVDIIASGAHPVVGTTGFQPEQIKILQNLSTEKKLGGVIAPNFSIGAILLMQCAQQVAKYFPHVEIIELHHNAKVDAPSGTAVKTAEMIASNRSVPEMLVQEKELIPGARGGISNNIHLHSVRLPGLVAHEEVIFGDIGQTLTLRHDTYHREAFMPGVILACKKVIELDHLVYGLEHIL